jgi:hypothetical protein
MGFVQQTSGIAIGNGGWTAEIKGRKRSQVTCLDGSPITKGHEEKEIK